MTVYSQNLSMDSISYPRWGTDLQGNQIVTITKNQQQSLNQKLIQLSQCNNRELIKIDYIKALELQLADYELLESKYDSAKTDCSILLDNREQKISQLNIQLGLKDDLIQQSENKYKATKRKLLGWKIGTLYHYRSCFSSYSSNISNIIIMAILKLEEVINKGIEIYTTGDYTKKYHPKLSQHSLQYAMKHGMVHYCKVGRTSFIVNTEVTQAYTPRAEFKGKRANSIKDKPKIKYMASGGEVDANQVFKLKMYKRCDFIREHCPSATPNNIEYAVKVGNLDVVYIGSVRLIALTEHTKKFNA